MVLEPVQPPDPRNEQYLELTVTLIPVTGATMLRVEETVDSYRLVGIVGVVRE